MNTLTMALFHPNLLPTFNSIKLKPFSRPHVPPPTPARFRLSASAITEDAPPQPEKLGVVVKPTEKPRLVLKFIWMEKNIGIALDQMIPGHGSIPLSPYYFWPRKDAWEELKELLESKPWISQKQMIILLNQATDIINLWQQSGGNLS
ncbi:30S ribosomal protein 3, chloroplastic [Mucuna pruriens]|uniref:30S ribosomal protein 3, chloroplastic n=1 Tax=Mucuna pruriens TaxID=157652 RepID=A0A371IF24_MUCPR|nr:30S ribosomal protein 3, chloroplastic [Mucuna pruriens]